MKTVYDAVLLASHFIIGLNWMEKLIFRFNMNKKIVNNNLILTLLNMKQMLARMLQPRPRYAYPSIGQAK